MTKLTRREWNRLALTGMASLLLPRCAGGKSIFSGSPSSSVIIGVNSYSFRDRSMDAAIAAIDQLKIPSCELWQGHAEPEEMKEKTPEERSKFRLALPLSHYYGVREKFDKIGVPIQAYSIVFHDSQSDEEIEKAFQVVKALGTNTITTTATISVMPRVDVYARKYKVDVGIHNHDKVEDPNAFSTPESFLRAMKGNSDYIKLNLDIGHFVAANYDPVSFIKENHQKIVCLHIKDREKNHGPKVVFGEGDTPINEVMRLLRDNKWNIPANIEYEYPGENSVVEVQRCVEYCKRALMS